MKNKSEVSQSQQPTMALAVDVKTIFKVQIPNSIQLTTDGGDSSFLVEIEEQHREHRNNQQKNVVVKVPCPHNGIPGQWVEVTMIKNQIENIALLPKDNRQQHNAKTSRRIEKNHINQPRAEFDIEKSKFLCKLTFEYNHDQMHPKWDDPQSSKRFVSDGKIYNLTWEPTTTSGGEESLSTNVDDHIENQEMMITTPAMMMISPSDIIFVKEQQPLHKKIKWFQEMSMCLETEQGLLRMSVRRQYILEDSFEFIMGLQKAEDLRKLWSDDSFQFVSQNSKSLPSRRLPPNVEWFRLVSKKLFDPQLGLWMYGEDNVHMVINPTSETSFSGRQLQRPRQNNNTSHLDYFRFTGRLLGMAVLYGNRISAYLDLYLYKLLLGIPLQFQDLESMDNESYHKLSHFISMSNHGQDVSNLELEGVFPINRIDPTLRNSNHGDEEMPQQQQQGVGGSSHNNRSSSSNNNKDGVGASSHHGDDPYLNGWLLQQDRHKDNLPKYVEACLKYKLIRCVEPQVTELLRGFQDVIPSSGSSSSSSGGGDAFCLISVFDETEFEQILSDPLEEFNTNYLKRQVTWQIGNHPCMDWFWNVANRLDKDRKTQLCACLYNASQSPTNHEDDNKHTPHHQQQQQQQQQRHKTPPVTPKQLALLLHHRQCPIHIRPCAHFRIETTSSNHHNHDIIKLHIPKCNTPEELQEELIHWIELHQDLWWTNQPNL